MNIRLRPRLAAVALLTAVPAAAHADASAIALPGTRSAALATASDLGAASGETVVSARLLLTRPAARQAALDQLTAAQQDPASPLYHDWLSATALGAQFGPSAAAIKKATDWLTARGLTVGAVSPAGTSIAFSGTASAIQAAFAAPIHAYVVRGRALNAFGATPQLPATLAGTVAGLTGLGGDRPEPLNRPAGPVVRYGDGSWRRLSGIGSATPSLTTTVSGVAQQDVAPADFATIYDVNPLRTGSHPLTGAGQTIGVVEDSDMSHADWMKFRTAFGLSSYSGLLSANHTGCTDPGTNADESEAALDAEWASAVAPAAAIVVSSCSDASGGTQAALQSLIDQKLPPRVISVSFGECESELGASAAASWAALLQQAANEGISVFVSTGDSGSAGCDDGNAVAAGGIAVNGLASTPYNVAVGGTDFSDFASNSVSTYWNTTNDTTYGSARSYIPEIPWNDTCANPVLATYEGSSSTVSFCNTSTGRSFLAPGGGGGGASILTAKPSFQSTSLLGMPNDNARDLPDVSLFASNGLFGHALVYCMSDTTEGGSACTYTTGSAVEASSAGGTSFAAPSFAGIQALIDQKENAAQGNPDARLYALAATQFNTAGSTCSAANGAATSSACLFHDVVTGGNDQACRSGSANCYTGGGRNRDGVLSTSTTAERDAYAAATGYDLATGLGSVDVANLVNAY